MSEIFTESREDLQVEFSEIVLSEAREEPLTSGPCRLVVPVSWERLREPVSSSRLTFLEVYIAKIFEVTIHNSTLPGGKCENGLGSSNQLIWSIFIGDSDGSKDGQRWFGNYIVPRKLACEKAKEYGLASSESTLLNEFGVGTIRVDIPVLSIVSDENINKWKQFVGLFLANFPIAANTNSITLSVDEEFQHPIDKELEDCRRNNPSTQGERNCWLRAYDQWDEELNRIYSKLRQKLDSQGQKVLEDAQLKWLEYRDKEFALVDNIYSEQRGSMQLVSNAARRAIIVKTRVTELNRYLESTEQTSSERSISQGLFEGISENGDIQEALADAIHNAKNQLKTTLVNWKFYGISGENGGFTQINRLSVAINASSSVESKTI